MMESRELFGGAITLSTPSTYFDVRYKDNIVNIRDLLHSTIRQIPDNQEVWLERNSDASIIIELVQTPESFTDQTAFAKYPKSSLNVC